MNDNKIGFHGSFFSQKSVCIGIPIRSKFHFHTFLTFVNSGRIPVIQNFNPLKICPIWYFTFGLSCVQVTIPNTLCVGSSVILVLLLEATCISYLVVWFVQGMS